MVANGVQGGDNTVALDKEANHQHHETEEEWADWDSDTTVLDNEDKDEKGEWCDSNDSAFNHNNDDNFKLGAQLETSIEVEPTGVWIPSEANTVGGPW